MIKYKQSVSERRSLSAVIMGGAYHTVKDCGGKKCNNLRITFFSVK